MTTRIARPPRRVLRSEGHDHVTLKGIPVLMLTAVNVKSPLGFSSHDLDDVWLPVDDFLEKPVDLEVLLNKVSALLRTPGSPGREERAASCAE